MRRLLLKSAAFLLIFALSAGLLGAGKASASVTPMVAGGWNHSLALKSDGTVWTWGSNYYGQLGDGTTTNRTTPVQVKDPGGSGYLMGIVAVAAGTGHSLALKSDGTVWAWGWNYSGQLGDGTTTNRYTPVQVKGPGGAGYLTGVVAVAAGYSYSLALKSDGTVWAWGDNGYGQLGDGTTTDRTTPVRVSGLTGVVAIATRGTYYLGYSGHSLALKSDGTVWAWGFNYWGQLGDGTTTNRTTPVRVSGLTGVVAVATGSGHSLALKSDGTVWAWGYNGSGQLGDGTTTDRYTPVQVKGPGGSGYLTGVVAVATGNNHPLALKSDGTVWTWGSNYYGQLGDGTTTNRTTPVQVKGPGGSGYLTDVVGVAAGSYHSLALKSDGTVWAWGGQRFWPARRRHDYKQHDPGPGEGPRRIGLFKPRRLFARAPANCNPQLP